MGEENLGSFHILFQGFGMLAWHCNWEASRQANAFAKVCHQVPVDIAWVNPWEPHLAIATSSWCSAPSKVTHSASHLMVVPGSLPWHQRVSNAVAKAVLSHFLKGSSRIPSSCSSCQPLSLLAIAFSSPTWPYLGMLPF